jgi:hypothetical protein
MKIRHGAAAAAVVAALAGCAGQMPQTAEEFRKAVPGAFLTKTESYEVDRPFREVAATFQRRAPECLGMTVQTTSRTTTSYQVIVTTYKPTVVVGSGRAELHLQQTHERGVVKVYKEPEGGYYLLVADAYPVGNSRTRIELFGPSRGYDVVYRAIQGWATGDNLGCPDLTKIG